MGNHLGAWRNDISPHLVRIMDTWSLPHVRQVILCKAPQTGGTEAMFNCAEYAMSRDPSMMMLAMPTQKMLKKSITDRVIPMIRQSGCLRELVSPNPDDTSMERIRLQNGAILYTCWANSPTAASSFPIQYLFCDEIDKNPTRIGKEAGSLELIEKRVITFPHTHKIFKVSTPTSEDGLIWQAWLAADVRYRYHVNCPKCEESHIMSIQNLRYPAESAAEIFRDNLAFYECPHCQAGWTDIVKQKAVRRGQWIQDGKQAIKQPRTVAFHLPAWVSPDISISQIAAAYELSKSGRAKLIDFYNAYLAEPYVETISGESLSEDAIYQRRYQYFPAGASWRIPLKAVVLTCAVDVQTSPPRLEVEVVAWGEGYESWGIEYRVLPGDPAGDAVWSSLDAYLSREWEHESGIKMKISACGVDTGGHYARQVYHYCRRRSKVFALKGSNVRGKPLVTSSTLRTTLKNKVQLWIVGTDTAKDTLFDWMQRAEPGPGYMHFHEGYDYSYFRMLTSEACVLAYDKSGRPHKAWRKKSSDARTEALDIRVYSLATLEILNPKFAALSIDLERHIENKKNQAPKEKPVRQKQIGAPLRKSRGGWVKGWQNQ